MVLQKAELFQILKVAKTAAEQANQLLIQHFGQLSSIEEKHRAGLVTNVDRESEQLIMDIFAKETPDFEVLGEEAAFENPKSICPSTSTPKWIIDPLDGTTNYVHQLPIFCVSIGLELNGEAQLGVVSVPMLNQTFAAVKAAGATCNDKPISVSGRKDLSKALVATGFVTSKPEALTEQLELFDNIVTKARGIRRTGSAAFDLVMVAMGVYDAFWESQLQPWDTAAGHLIVQEAGGRVSQFDGSDYNAFSETILASNHLIHDQIQNALSSHS